MGEEAPRNAAQPMPKTGSMLKGDVCLLMSLATSAEISRTHIFSVTVLPLHLLSVLPGASLHKPPR